MILLVAVVVATRVVVQVSGIAENCAARTWLLEMTNRVHRLPFLLLCVFLFLDSLSLSLLLWTANPLSSIPLVTPKNRLSLKNR